MKASIFRYSNKNIVRISALKFFVASWGIPGSFLGLTGDLVSNIIKNVAYRKPKKLPGSYKIFQGRNSDNFFVAILENHKSILSLTNLYLEKHLWDCENGFGKIETILNVLHAFHK